MDINYIIITGLISDVVGAILLGIAFFKVKYKVIVKQTIPIAGIHPLIFNSLNEQQAYGKVGTLFLIFGFLQQMLGNFIIINQFHLFFGLVLFINLLIYIFLFIYKNTLIKRNLTKVKLEYDALNQEEQNELEMWYGK
ncbi:hypothetical protein V7138_15040 [Bacillus sp. JJ1533]|uniref:hypothetical protein n=1 Tax=Bacillus sp. JJ1533 TaxID=3122959 RepID=UPI002FFD838E